MSVDEGGVGAALARVSGAAAAGGVGAVGRDHKVVEAGGFRTQRVVALADVFNEDAVVRARFDRWSSE